MVEKVRVLGDNRGNYDSNRSEQTDATAEEAY